MGVGVGMGDGAADGWVVGCEVVGTDEGWLLGWLLGAGVVTIHTHQGNAQSINHIQATQKSTYIFSFGKGQQNSFQFHKQIRD